MFKFLVTLFFGWAGIHKFMEKKVGMGILYFCTFGLFTIGWIVDTIKSGMEVFKKTSNFKQSLPDEFEIAGAYYKQAEIASVAQRNPLYQSAGTKNKRIYKYSYTRKDAVLIPEPHNEHDPNAIMVQIDGITVGYIPKDLCNSVKHLLKAKAIKGVAAQIYGGDCKYIDYEGDLVKHLDTLNIKLHIIL